MGSRDTGAAGEPGRRPRGELAGEIFDVVSASDAPLTATEVRERMRRRLAYTTVVTTLARLHAKGSLTRSRHGRSHRYAPSTTAAGLVARRMQHALDDHDDRRAVLTHFVSELTDEDERLLRTLLADDGEGGPPERRP